MRKYEAESISRASLSDEHEADAEGEEESGDDGLPVLGGSHQVLVVGQVASTPSEGSDDQNGSSDQVSDGGAAEQEEVGAVGREESRLEGQIVKHAPNAQDRSAYGHDEETVYLTALCFRSREDLHDELSGDVGGFVVLGVVGICIGQEGQVGQGFRV